MNTFSQGSDEYAGSRPSYPDALFSWLAQMAPNRNTAWDCATGNGQAAVSIAEHFSLVDATDSSPEQITHARPGANIRYSVCAAEKTPFPDATFDLITVAQALHWFDYAAFWPEVSRVAKPGCFFCAWGYDWFEADAELDRTLLVAWRNLLRPFWATNNGILWRGYTPDEVRPPFPSVSAPQFAITLTWDLQQLLAYMRTWSAYKRADQATKAKLELVATRSSDVLGPATRFPLRMPLRMLCGYLQKA